MASTRRRRGSPAALPERPEPTVESQEPLDEENLPVRPRLAPSEVCSTCRSEDVVLVVKNDPSASDAAFCRTHRPANR